MDTEITGPDLALEVLDKRRKPKMSERVAHRLVSYIVENDLPEGTPLPVESELAKALDVGRTTLREALLLLETWGVITVKPGRNGGPAVRRPRPIDLQQALALQLQFASATLDDVMEARTAIEPMTARLAAQRMTPEELDELQTTVQHIRDDLDNQSIFLHQNRRFHSLIAQATGSVVLRAFTDSIKSIADGASVGVQYGRRHRVAVADAHDRIVKAIRLGDGDSAEAAMRIHLEEASAYWNTYADEASRPLRWL